MKPDPNSPFSDDRHFEVEVRRLAKLIWPSARIYRSPLVEGRERDVIVQTPDLVYVIEATTSRKQDKVTTDARKTNSLVRKIRGQGFASQGIIILLHEPTAEQEDAAKKYRISVHLETFEQFLSRIFDASGYMQSRINKRFGSIQNPRDAHFALGREYYVQVPIIDAQSNRSLSVSDLSVSIRDHSARFVILADFGSGKSMSLREVFYLLREEFVAKRHARFPIYVNLRDHAGASIRMRYWSAMRVISAYKTLPNWYERGELALWTSF